MNETKVIAACLQDREAYENAKGIVDEDTFTSMGKYWYDTMAEYYELDSEARSVDIEVLRERGLREVNQNQSETIDDYFTTISADSGVSPSNVVRDLFAIRRSTVGKQLARQLLDPESTTDDILGIMEAYQTLISSDGTSAINYASWDNLSEQVSRQGAIQLAPSKLNAKLRGGAIPGDHILIFGRPEVGKSLFALNMAAAAAKQNHRVLYMGNEEPIERTMQRMACNIARATFEQYDSRTKEVEATAIKKGAKNITAVHLTPGDLREVEYAIKECKPNISFLDQLTGLDYPDANEVTRVGRLARGYRSIVQRHNCVGVSVAQAGDKTERHGQEPPAFLSLSDVYGSRTGIPAQCDLLVGVGSNEEMRARGQRGISLPKNKLGGDHGNFTVSYDEARSRVL